MRVDPRLGLAALWLGSTLGCTKPEPPVSNADPAPIEQLDELATPEAAEAAPDSNSNPLYRDIDLTRDPTQVGADLAARWCALGGDAFRPPPADPNAEVDVEFPPQLRDCGEVTVEQHRRDERDGIRATHLTIDASSYEQIELVLLQSSEHAAVLELYRDTYDSSGEEGTVSREHYEVELRDVTGTPAPEWIAKLGENGGDSYEADRCYANESDARELILCSEGATGFVCAWDSYHSTSTSEPRAKHQLGECDVPAKQLTRRSVSGYAMDVEVRRDVVVFSPSETKIHEPEDPPHVGEIAISALLAEPAELSASAGVQGQ